MLVGTAELSFSASVRTKFLTLNAPEVRLTAKSPCGMRASHVLGLPTCLCARNQTVFHSSSALTSLVCAGSTSCLDDKLQWILLIQDCGYLCNMAVAEDYQRRGFGMALLRALEHTSEIVRQPDIYLHLRYALNVPLCPY